MPTELLDEVIRVVLSPCPTSQDEDASPTEDTDHPSAHISLVEKMCELVGIAFDSSGVGSFQRTSGRLREQALDSLGAVVENARTNGKEAETSDVLDVVALGARDEKWFVRAAAGRVAMDAIRHLKSTEDFTGFSMSRHVSSGVYTVVSIGKRPPASATSFLDEVSASVVVRSRPSIESAPSGGGCR